MFHSLYQVGRDVWYMMDQGVYPDEYTIEELTYIDPEPEEDYDRYIPPDRSSR